MQADDEYAFTAWISLKLDPIVRHDPQKVAVYIVAALKKNKDGKDMKTLRQFLRRKLDEFIEDKERLNDFCEELSVAIDDKRYLEVREHPSYATLLDTESAPLTPSNKEYPNVKEEKRYEGTHQTRRRRSGSYSDDEDESVEDRPPLARVTPEKKATVSSTISVVKDTASKRVGEQRAPIPPSKQLCEDFTKKGFCLRGQLCPFDHGNDAVVWQNARPMEVIRYAGPPRPIHLPMPQRQRLPGFPPMMPMGMMRPMPPPFRPDGPPGIPPFNLRPKPPPPPNNYRPRELIALPSDEHLLRGGDLGKREGDMRMVNNMPVKRMAIDGSSSGNNCSLEIHEIPLHLNNIAALNAHFFKYGNIVNVQVRYNGSPGSALVTFQTPDAANRAFNSSEPVLNNRFIKIDWHNPNRSAAPAGLPISTTKAVPVSASAAAPPPPVHTMVAPPEPHPPAAEESHEVTVTRGFTQGLRVRYPVGARRARAGRHIATAPSARGTHAAVSSSSAHTGLQSQQQQTVGMSAHHRSIYLSLQASKTESELEKIQSHVASLDESIAKVGSLMRNFQETSEKLKGRDMESAGANKEEATQMLEKMEKQIQQLQREHQRFEEDRTVSLKKQAELEARLTSQKNHIEAQKSQNEKDNGMDQDEMEPEKDTLPYERTPMPRTRAMARRATRGRVAVSVGTRGGGSPKRAATGVTRFRRPARGQPFNRTVDRRPRRLKLSGLDEADRQLISGQVHAHEANVENTTEPDATSTIITFATRYDAESFLRDLIGASEGRKMATAWLADSHTAAGTAEDHVLELQGLEMGGADNSRDAFDTDSDRAGTGTPAHDTG